MWDLILILLQIAFKIFISLLPFFIIVFAVIIISSHIDDRSVRRRKSDLEIAAENGNPMAQYRMGYDAYRKRDYKGAVYWLCMSELNGEAEASVLLRELADSGLVDEIEDIAVTRTTLRMHKDLVEGNTRIQ